MNPGWYEETHGAANSAPRWTWAELRARLGCDRGGCRYSRAVRIQAELALMREEGEQPVWDEMAASGKWPGVTG